MRRPKQNRITRQMCKGGGKSGKGGGGGGGGGGSESATDRPRLQVLNGAGGQQPKTELDRQRAAISRDAARLLNAMNRTDRTLASMQADVRRNQQQERRRAARQRRRDS